MAVLVKVVANRGVLFGAAGLAALLFLAPGRLPVARAHETTTVGNTAIECGWLNEPPVAGQPNAVVINITPPDSASTTEVDASALKIQALFRGETKALMLQPFGENTPGQFIAPMTPMRPGTYTIHLSGYVGSTNFDTDVVPEEVHTTDLVQFPIAAGKEGTSSIAPAMGIAGWLGVAGFVLGAIGTVLGVIAISRKPARE